MTTIHTHPSASYRTAPRPLRFRTLVDVELRRPRPPPGGDALPGWDEASQLRVTCSGRTHWTTRRPAVCIPGHLGTSVVAKEHVLSRTHALPHNPVGRVTRDHPGLVKVGRAGWFAKGVVYVGAGALSLLVAAKASGWSHNASTGAQEASPTGALTSIAQMSGGRLLMWVLAAGMLLYAAWRLVSASLPGGSDAKATVMRLGYLVSAIIYTTFALTAISLARVNPSAPDGNVKVSTLSERVMAHSGGRLVIGLAGVIAIGAGVYRIIKGLRVDVTDELDLTGWSTQRRSWTKRTGAIGEFGRGIGIALIGFFLVRAAMSYDPNEATGLDGALRRLAVQRWGLVVVVVVGVGFAAYGVFCLLTFTRRELQAP
jgi:hypothetical protein